MTSSHGRRNLAATLRLRIAIIYFTCAFGLTPAKAVVTIPLPASPSSLQSVAASDLPDAPEDTQSSPAANSSSGKVAPADAGEEQQTKRILWIMPNFSAVSTGIKLPKQSVKEKFKTAALDSFDYSSFSSRKFIGLLCVNVSELDQDWTTLVDQHPARRGNLRC